MLPMKYVLLFVKEKVSSVKDREKEIKLLLYLKAELIKETKKEMKKLNDELRDYQGQKRLNAQKRVKRRK